MSAFLLRRLLSAVGLLLLVLTFTFALLHLVPGEPTDRFDDPRIPGEQRERLSQLYGFDRPLPEQYVRWLGAFVVGDLGYSHLFAAPVTEVLGRVLPPTLLLGTVALLLAVTAGLALGVSGAQRAGGRADRWLRFVGSVTYATPSFWLGLLALLLFAHRLDWLPPGGLRSPTWSSLSTWGRVADIAWHLVLPSVVLAAPLAVEIARFVRQGLLDVAASEFLLAARARGIPERRLLWRHALRNAVGPAIQVLGIAAPAYLAGALVVEVVFDWPGLGATTARAALAQDTSLVLGAAAVSGALVVLGTLAADLAQGVVDPRVRVDRPSEPRPW